MLSLLSLLLASGTVLRADTERWTPLTYPNPRRNHTACNTSVNSTLCDPDHILTDQWRTQINENIQRQMQKLTEANVPLTDKAPAECANQTEGVTIFVSSFPNFHLIILFFHVLLAKRIWTPNNQSISGNDLTNFGDELAKQYGMNDLSCKTFLFLIGIEAAKLAYVRTGKDLRLPADLMQRVFHEYKLFNAKNFMAGLNKIVDEIGRQMADPFKDQSLTTTSNRIPLGNGTSISTDSTTLAEIVSALEESEAANRVNVSSGSIEGEVGQMEAGRMGTAAAWWMFITLGTAIVLAFGALALLAITQQQRHNGQQPAKRSLGPLRAALNSFSSGKQQQLEVSDLACQQDPNAQKSNNKNNQIADVGKNMGNRETTELGGDGVKREDAFAKTGSSSIASSSMADQNSDLEDLESGPRVRIDPDELATDVIGQQAMHKLRAP